MSAPDLPTVEATDGAALLTELHRLLTKYVAFPSAEAADAVVLYIAATHAQPAWEHATRLVIKSPLKRCGKSRLQEVIAETCHWALRTANCSTAALVRSIGTDDPPTILLDEADTVFGGRKASKDSVAEDLRGFINSGHSRGAPYLRWDMNKRELEECPTFAMAVLAGIGDMPDTIEDRAVVISMRRRAASETVAPFRRRCIPELHHLRDRLGEWLGQYTAVLQSAEPTLPVEDRAADVWEPLVAVASLAGGEWPERGRTACTVLTGESTDDADTAGERLLADLWQIWGNEEAVATNTLLDRLHKIDEAPWSEWYGGPLTARGLAKLLKPYGVKSRTIRTEDGTPKGYHRADMADPWGRYATSATAPHAEENRPPTSENGCGGYVADDIFTSATGSDLGKDGTCGAVADVAVTPAVTCSLCGGPLTSPLDRAEGVCAACDYSQAHGKEVS